MKPGYLAVHTHDAHRGWVRLVATPERPDPGSAAGDSTHIRYIARFNDGDAALMHAHEILKRRLIDPDARLYHADCEHAVAAIESIDLRRRTLYWDPHMDAATRTTIARQAEGYRVQRRRRDHFFETLGLIGVAILLFNLFVLSLA